MFDNSYPFTFRFRKVMKGPHLIARSTYFFSTEGEKYMIECEEYSESIFIIKFFPKRLKDNSKRFNMLTGENKMGKIVATCIQLVLQLLKKNNKASFGFVGSHTYDARRQYIEDRSCTKRFKIYRYAVYSLIGEQAFTHFMEERNSTYLLINNKHDNVDEVKEKANRMFDAVFPTLNGI